MTGRRRAPRRGWHDDHLAAAWESPDELGRGCRASWPGKALDLDSTRSRSKPRHPKPLFVAGQPARSAARARGFEGRDHRATLFLRESARRTATREFFFNVLPEGPLSPRLAVLGAGDPVFMLPNANGFFTMAEAP